MNDITRKRAQRVIERQVADGSRIRLGDGQIIKRDRRAQQTASQAVIMTSTTGHGAHLIALWSAAPAGTASLVLLIASPSSSVAGQPLRQAVARPGYFHHAAVSGRRQRRTSRRRTDAEAQAECSSNQGRSAVTRVGGYLAVLALRQLASPGGRVRSGSWNRH